MSVRTPKYRLHKATGQTLVQIDGRRIYLGKYGTPESEELYRRTVAEWLDGGLKPDESYSIAIRDHSLTVAELISGYFNFAKRAISCSKATGARLSDPQNLILDVVKNRGRESKMFLG